MVSIAAHVPDSGHYQSLQHFISHSTWSSERVWEAIRSRIPDRKGVLIVDDTGIPKRGKHSVGVKRQYSGTLGKTGNCQILVSTVLRSEDATWLLGMNLYLPEDWANDARRRTSAGVPESVEFRRKWELALGQIDQAIASGFEVECVLADAGYGNWAEFRAALSDRGLPYAVAVNKTSKVFAGPPLFGSRNSKGERTLQRSSPKPVELGSLAECSDTAWKKVTWRKGSKGSLHAEFKAIRVIPAHCWKKKDLHEECWLLCERSSSRPDSYKFHFSSLPKGISLKQLVEITHRRWAVEQNYEQLKDELALDHFEGRSFVGHQHHIALTAMAFTFLGMERGRSRAEVAPTLNQIRRLVTEIVTAKLFATDERLSRLVLQFMRDPPPD